MSFNMPKQQKNCNTNLPLNLRIKFAYTLNINFLRIGEDNEVNRGFPFKHR